MKNTMWTLLVAISLAILCWIAPDVARAQAPSDEGTRGALLFSLSGLTATPTSFDNVGIGGRYKLASGLAIRAGLGLLRSSLEQEQEGADPDDEQELQLALEGGVEKTLFRSAPVSIYVGGIAQLGYGSVEPNDDTVTTGTSLTLAGVLGATYFFSNHLSLGAEYRLGLRYSSTETEQGEFKSSETETVFGTGAVGFLLGFWF